MTAERSAPHERAGDRPSGAPTADDDAIMDVAYEGDEYGGEEYDELDEPDAPDPDAEASREGRGWPLGTMLAVAFGIWIGRWFGQLPEGAEDTAGLLLVVVTAVLAAALYRRWVRRQMAQARARRARR